MTPSITGHGVTQSEPPHFNTLKVTSSLHFDSRKSVSFRTPASVTTVKASPSDVFKSFCISSLYVQTSMLTSSRQPRKVQTTEAMRVMMSSKFDKTIGPVRLTSVVSGTISTNAKETVATTLILRTYVTSSFSSDTGITDSPKFQLAVSSTLLDSTLGFQTSLPQLSLSSSASSSQTETPTLMSTSTIWLPYTPTEEITTESTEAEKTTILLSLKSSRLQNQISSSKEVVNSSASTPRIVVPTPMSTPSVGSRCDPDVSAPPTLQPEKSSTIPGIVVLFELVEDDQELVRNRSQIKN